MAGLLAAAAGFSANPAVLMVAGVAVALLTAYAARGRAHLKHLA